MKVGFALLCLVGLLSAFGYLRNVAKLITCDFASPYKCEVLHGLGVVVPPVGVVMGYVDVGQ